MYEVKHYEIHRLCTLDKFTGELDPRVYSATYVDLAAIYVPLTQHFSIFAQIISIFCQQLSSSYLSIMPLRAHHILQTPTKSKQYLNLVTKTVLANMSTRFIYVEIFYTVIEPSEIISWIKCNLTSICFFLSWNI